jgi:hypothetical protein
MIITRRGRAVVSRRCPRACFSFFFPPTPPDWIHPFRSRSDRRAPLSPSNSRTTKIEIKTPGPLRSTVPSKDSEALVVAAFSNRLRTLLFGCVLPPIRARPRSGSRKVVSAPSTTRSSGTEDGGGPRGSGSPSVGRASPVKAKVSFAPAAVHLALLVPCCFFTSPGRLRKGIAEPRVLVVVGGFWPDLYLGSEGERCCRL